MRQQQTITYIVLNTALIVFAIGFVACNRKGFNTSYNQTSPTNILDNNLPLVVATNSVICDLTKQIAQQTINLACLIPPGSNPTIYQPTSADRQKIERANLILYHGYNFEPQLMKIIKASPARQIAVGQKAVAQPLKFVQNGKKITEPHIWHSTNNAIKMLEIINESLSKAIPDKSGIYDKNTAKLTNEFTQMNNWIKSRIASIPVKKRKLMTTHEAMIYYAQAYELPYVKNLKGIKNTKKLTNRKIENLAQDIRKMRVKTIFVDTTTSSQLVEPVAQEAKVRIFARKLYLEGLGEPGSDGETYQKMMDANTRSIVEGLGGTYLKFSLKKSR
ncbi:metal ABC transporter solute-binding protein, Zn/Mn family [Richelia sinica]|uniref:metal ABC transporter solute-binding protein, Zn/Mn family n=1 Tax=Richelia sinica TaxID=1357545 RepID=UPI0016868816|nr:zinc ABC transporter substrate-binding protein [Richelia sinica]MBD2666376.1 zinc ABC transporter substrate-binding protein [Richelia sinica FACHB-800]